MSTNQQTIKRKYDLIGRCLKFAYNTRTFLHSTNNKLIFSDDKKQLIRSSGSVGANYLEANEAISPKDFLLRIRIAKKEAMESIFWLRLLGLQLKGQDKMKGEILVKEAWELAKILGSILKKYK